MTAIWLLVAFSSVGCIAAESKNVPVLIWNSHPLSNKEFPTVSSLEEVSVATLQSRYLDAFGANNILLFLQDSLSVEDLSSHAAELSNVSSLWRGGQHLYLPKVVKTHTLQHQLLQHGQYTMTTLHAGSAVAELKLEPHQRNLVVVRLPPTLTNPSRSVAFRKSGEIIAGVLSKIGAAADFTVMYTGLRPTTSSAPHHLRITRSLQQAKIGEKELENFHHTPCVFLYLRRNMTLSLAGEGFVTLPDVTVTEPIAHCPPPHGSNAIGLKYNDVDVGGRVYHRITVTVHFVRDHTGWWSPYVDVAVVEKTDNSRPPTTRLHTRKAAMGGLVPLGQSFTCGNTLTYRGDGMVLRLNGVQMQAFMTGQSQFGPSWNCVGFFTPGIWMGLLTAGLGLLILGFGLGMILAVRPMDRFDDPKAKALVVTTADEH